jgi:hypothetical protein
MDYIDCNVCGLWHHGQCYDAVNNLWDESEELLNSKNKLQEEVAQLRSDLREAVVIIVAAKNESNHLIPNNFVDDFINRMVEVLKK